MPPKRRSQRLKEQIDGDEEEEQIDQEEEQIDQEEEQIDQEEEQIDQEEARPRKKLRTERLNINTDRERVDHIIKMVAVAEDGNSFKTGFCQTEKGDTIVAIVTGTDVPKNDKPWVYVHKNPPRTSDLLVVRDEGYIVWGMKRAVRQCCMDHFDMDKGGEVFETVHTSDNLTNLNKANNTALNIIATYQDAEERYKGDFSGIIMSVPIAPGEFLTMSTLQAIRVIRSNAIKEGGDEVYDAKKIKVET